MNRLLIFFVALLLLFVGGSFFWIASNRTSAGNGSVSEKDTEYVPPPKELTEFEFKDQLGKPFNSKQLDGKVWMASFFFSTCPGVCVTQNANIADVHRRFLDQDVTILSISVQPEVDLPHVLLLYAKRFEADHAKWKFLTGKDVGYIRQVGAEFFALPAADTSHTSEVALFDQNGKMHGPYKVTDAREQTDLILKTEELLKGVGNSIEDNSSSDQKVSPEITTTEEQAVSPSQES